ncbi:MAG: hypothetical protein VB106_01685, partial [Clostridiaceae bacterium]|nr:hypothetical protein [Clostridiaceae bacterium]
MSPKKNDAPGSAVNEEDSLYSKTADVSSDNIRSIFGNNTDFVCRGILIRDNPKTPVTLAYLDGLID